MTVSSPGCWIEDESIKTPTALAASPTEILECVWSEEAFTTPSTGNDSQRYDLYGSPLLRTPSWDGTLHWASTETGAVAPGHLEGALEAAERAVASVLSSTS